MRIATWNVNSLNVRLPHVLDWLGGHRPDVLMLQETKLTDDRFPVEELRSAGYHAVFSGQKTYNGVRHPLARAPRRASSVGSPPVTDEQRRTIAATVAGVRVVNLYVVNGQAVGSEKYDYKLEWLRQVTGHLRTELREHEHVVVAGDFNIAPEDRDVHDPEEWKDSILCSGPGARRPRRHHRARARRHLPPVRAAGAFVLLVGLPGRGVQAQPRAANRSGTGVGRARASLHVMPDRPGRPREGAAVRPRPGGRGIRPLTRRRSDLRPLGTARPVGTRAYRRIVVSRELRLRAFGTLRAKSPRSRQHTTKPLVS